jgi:endonuclease-3
VTTPRSAGRPARAASKVQERADEVRARLSNALPSPRCELRHESAWQLLIATILSAQSTDRTVNRVTPVLFARWPTPQALAAAAQEEVEEVVKSTGFFRNKAKAIRETSKELAERFGGEVPRTVEEAVTLRGVARKTANVVLGTAYGVNEGVIVDTHCWRVSQRLGLTKHDDPVKIEQDLMKRFPRETWGAMGHRLVLHGRYVCTAKKPDCPNCPLNEICPSAEAGPEGTIEDRCLAEGARINAALDTALAPA